MTKIDLTGKNAIVTGGSMGIGSDICRVLGACGANVALNYRKHADEAKAIGEEVEKAGGKAMVVQADVASFADAGKMVDAVVAEWGTLDILVCNAGINWDGVIWKMSEEQWDKVIDINLKGAFLYAKAAGAIMVEAGRGGRIINLASIDGMRPNGMAAHYNASKGGVLMLTKAMALELAPHNILVNSVSPGGITTPGTDTARENVGKSMGIPEEDILQGWIQRVPLKRMGKPDEVARAVLFLAGAAADFITGANIVVDGGYLLS
jgi:2-dehydro-3-deoxy-D-gluconate 5-dehydrogenase